MMTVSFYARAILMRGDPSSPLCVGFSAYEETRLRDRVRAMRAAESLRPPSSRSAAAAVLEAGAAAFLATGAAIFFAGGAAFFAAAFFGAAFFGDAMTISLMSM